MKSISTFAIAVSLVVGGGAFAAPAFAAKEKKQAEAAGEKKMNLSKAEITALQPLQKAVQENDFATAATLLPAAQAAAKGQDAKYLVARFQYNIASNSKDTAAQAAAIEALLASGGVEAADQPKMYQALGALYTDLKQPDRARAAYQRLAQLDPNNVDVMLISAESVATTNKAEAINLIQKAIATRKASGQAVPENWYKRALKFAYEGKLASQTSQISRDLVAAYPTPDNWRDALTIYRQGSNLDKQAETDALRFLRAARALKGDADYFTLASNLNDMGLPGESQAVVQEGVGAKSINGSKDYFRQLLATTGSRVAADRASLPGLKTKALAGANGKIALSTGDAFYGYGDYTSAAELYRAAVQKGGVDANVANTRLGAALALAGQRAQAEAAFKAVTGTRAPLAQFWLLWLSQRG